MALILERTANMAENLEQSQLQHRDAMGLICDRLHNLERQVQPPPSRSDQPDEVKMSDLAKRRRAEDVTISVRFSYNPV